ncbi:Manganese/iron superoxide dismutase [Cristinia sonorae]|uniref:Manganese/iron superoxide dismutase n=1 Tax=Cristinia sonorae TaxID=1940300 RepID=A0A8K0UVZ2_9AGAR|nr:Manganese/iron superoxide dismutase [Cristinia sonorae]
MQGVGLRLAGASSRAAMRHTRPRWPPRSALHTLQEYNDVEKGRGEFLPPAAFRAVAIEYQGGLLERLNDEVRGTELESKSLAHTVIQAAEKPSHVMAFNYASEALNNDFFVKGLKHPEPSTSNEHEISDLLGGGIKRHFDSLEQLKSEFGGHALGMFSPGWVWLVCDAIGSLAIIPSFGTETLLIRSRQEMVDKPPTYLGYTGTARVGRGAPAGRVPPSNGVSQSRSYSTDEAAQVTSVYGKNHKVGDVLFPLLCLSIHEHAWLSAGHGIWGKEEYVKKFWKAVNWGQVSSAYAKFNIRQRTL